MPDGSFAVDLGNTFRIVPPDNADAAALSVYAQKILAKVLAPDEVFRILISTDDRISLRTILNATPPTIIVSKGTFVHSPTEDQLAARLYHELNQVRVRAKLGVGNVTRVEEAIADYRAVMDLHKAGYVPSQMSAAIQMLPDSPNDPLLGAIVTASDEHLSKHNRLSIVDDALVAIEQQRGISNTKLTPFPNEVSSHVSNIPVFEGRNVSARPLDINQLAAHAQPDVVNWARTEVSFSNIRERTSTYSKGTIAAGKDLSTLTQDAFLDLMRQANPLTRGLPKAIEALSDRRTTHRMTLQQIEQLAMVLTPALTDVATNKTYPLELSIDAYRLQSPVLFTALRQNSEIRRNLENSIKDRVNDLPSQSERLEAAQRILFSDRSINLGRVSSVNFLNPDFKRWAVETLIDAQSKLLGVDDGSPAYHERARAVMDEIAAHTSGAIKHDLLAGIAQKCTVQKTLAYHMRNQAEMETVHTLFNNEFHALIGELSLDALGRNEAVRTGIVSFLTSAPNNTNIDALHQILIANKGKSPEIERLLQHAEPELKEILLHQHRAFWISSLQQRTYMMEKLIFPPIGRSQENFERIRDQIIVTRFPATSQKAQMVRDAAVAYLNANQLPTQRYLLTTLMTAQEPSETSGDHSMGKTLTTLSKISKGAVAKFVQAINSHHQTPADIKSDTVDSKRMNLTGNRWDHIALIDSNESAATQPGRQVVHYGKVLGSGATGVVMELTLADGTRVARTVLHENIENRAQQTFVVLEKAGGIFVEKHPQMAPVQSIMNRARQDFALEIDMPTSATQAQIAARNYNGLVITVDGHDFIFKTARFLGHGERYKDAEIIEGQQFLDLPPHITKDSPKPNPQDDGYAYKKAAAKALLTAEMLLKMEGSATDNDRHGAQQRIQRVSENLSIVGNFDHGGQEIHPPTTEQKRALAQVIFDAYREFRSNPLPGAFIKAFSDRLNYILDSSDPHRLQTADFLEATRREVLAWGDFSKFVTRDDMKDILSTVIKSGRVDGVFVFEALKQANLQDMRDIASAAKSVLMRTPEEASNTKIQITDGRIDERLVTRRAIQSGASNGIGVAMGGYGLWNKFSDGENNFHQDLASGDQMRASLAVAGVAGDVANIGAGAVATVVDAAVVQRSASVATGAADNLAAATSGRMLAAGRLAGRAAIPLAVATGVLDAAAGAKAGDRERVAGAVGATGGGILGGIAAGAAVAGLAGATLGSAVPGVGTVVVGVVAGVGGGIAGAIVGEEAARRWGSNLAGRLIANPDAPAPETASAATEPAAPQRPPSLRERALLRNDLNPAMSAQQIAANAAAAMTREGQASLDADNEAARARAQIAQPQGGGGDAELSAFAPPATPQVAGAGRGAAIG